jgi:hypothetical protein
MYVVVLLMAPVLIIGARWNAHVTLFGSFALYAVALVLPLNLPSWPVAGGWFFNPLSWQFLLLLGFLAAERTSADPAFASQVQHWFKPALAVVAIGAAVKIYGFAPDPMAVPSPRHVFLFDKTYLSPARLISLLALVIVFHRLFDRIAPYLGSSADYLCGLGRNSLAVFCVGSVLSLVGQIVHFVVGGGLIVDTIIVGCGLVGMGWTAWFVEWRARSQSLSRPRPSE